jgi:hypothetical protein
MLKKMNQSPAPKVGLNNYTTYKNLNIKEYV